MTYDNWKTTDPRDAESPIEPPCRTDKMSGVCFICGNGPDEECGWENDYPLRAAANRIIEQQNRVLASVHAALMEGKVQEALARIRGQQ